MTVQERNHWTQRLRNCWMSLAKVRESEYMFLYSRVWLWYSTRTHCDSITTDLCCTFGCEHIFNLLTLVSCPKKKDESVAAVSKRKNWRVDEKLLHIYMRSKTASQPKHALWPTDQTETCINAEKVLQTSSPKRINRENVIASPFLSQLSIISTLTLHVFATFTRRLTGPKITLSSFFFKNLLFFGKRVVPQKRERKFEEPLLRKKNFFLTCGTFPMLFFFSQFVNFGYRDYLTFCCKLYNLHIFFHSVLLFNFCNLFCEFIFTFFLVFKCLWAIILS